MGENSGPAPAPENRINAIPTVKVTGEQARTSLVHSCDGEKEIRVVQVTICNVPFAWMISKKMTKRNDFRAPIIFMKTVYYDGSGW